MRHGQDPVEKFRSLLTALGETLAPRPNFWYTVAQIGWWQLLRESPPPVRVDNVLEAGFSPVEWEVNIVKCAWHLSKVVVERMRNQPTDTEESWEKFLDAVGLSKTAIESIPLDTSSELCDRILDILRWKEAVTAFDEDAIKTLGYAWFCEFIRQDRVTDQVTAETDAVFTALVLDSLGMLIGADSAGLIKQALSIEGAVPIDVRGWTEGFVRFPFGV